MKNLILASASPRRRELLSLFGIPFTVRVADIDEAMDPTKSPCDEVARVSCRKALAMERGPEDVVVAADTIVVCAGRVLGKPHSREEAVAMLQLLSGREHQVMTGCTVLCGDRRETFTEVTTLHFRPLSDGAMWPPANPWTRQEPTASRAAQPCSAPASGETTTM